MMNRPAIPNRVSQKFTSAEGRREIMKEFGGSPLPFHGQNEDGEQVLASIRKDGITIQTYQSNGWLRINYYDQNGAAAGETFNGKWR